MLMCYTSAFFRPLDNTITFQPFFYNLVLTNDFSFCAAFFTNDVRIEASTDQPTAGDNFTLTCTVTSDRPPSLSWTGSGVGSKGVVVHSQTVNGFTSTLVIEFSPLRTSHGGVYTCLSSISPSPLCA